MEILFTAKNLGSNVPLSDERRSIHTACIQDLYNTFSNDLNLTQLKSIIVPDDYSNEKIVVGSTAIATGDITDNEFGTGFACVVPEGAAPSIHYHVLIRKELIVSLLPFELIEDAKGSISEEEYSQLIYHRKLAINLIQHEFAHVHENSYSDHIHWLNEVKTQINVQSLYFSICDEVWGEYFACRMSCQTFPMFSSSISEFIKTVSEIEIMVQKKRKDYNLRNMSLEEFNMVFCEYTRLALKKAAYVAGNSYIFESDERNKIIKLIESGLAGSYLQEEWIEYFDELSSLFELFPDWETPETFSKLSKIIKKYHSKYEVSFSDTAEGIYFSVPVKL